MELKIYDPLLKELNIYNDCWLCGGTVRDVLLNRPFRDIDLVVPQEAIKFAKELASHLKATFIPLDEKEGVARVIYKDLIIDFSQFRKESKSIEQDLLFRDFTINSLAVPLESIYNTTSLKELTSYIIDPTNGLKDIKSKTIRSISPKNFEHDPLRLLRAIRFEVELGFFIEEKTSTWIKDLAPQITSVASERIKYELEIIMSQENSCAGIKSLQKHNLLLELIPEMSASINVEQPGFHHLDVFNHLIEALCQMDRIIANPEKFFSLSEVIKSWCKENHKKLPWLRFASLFHDIGKPYCLAKRDDGRVTFYQHDKKGAELVKDIGERLRWSKKAIEFTSKLVRLHMRPFFLIRDLKFSGPTPKAMIRLLKEIGEDYPALFMVAMSDALSASGPLTPKDMPDTVDNLFNKIHNFYLERLRPIEKAPPLLNGFDIQQIFNIKPGPIIGKILKAVEEAQVEGIINNKEEACNFVEKWLKKHQQNHHT